MKNDLLSRKITRKDSYVLPDKTDGTIFLSSVSDVMFKTMFNNTKRKKYPSYLLSLILNKDYNEILNNIEFSKDNLDKDNYHLKGESVDLVCKVDDEYYNIEVNNNTTKEKLERNLDYLCRMYGQNTKVGNEYCYNKCIQININNFNFEGNEKEIIEFEIKDMEGTLLTEKIKIIYIFLPLIRKKRYNIDKLSELEKFLLVMNEEKKEDIEKFTKGSVMMEEYRNEADEACRETNIVGLYNKEKEMEWLRKAELTGERKRGEEEGIQKGIKEGIEQNKLEIVKNMIKENIPEDTIIKVANITKEKLDEIKKMN